MTIRRSGSDFFALDFNDFFLGRQLSPRQADVTGRSLPFAWHPEKNRTSFFLRVALGKHPERPKEQEFCRAYSRQYGLTRIFANANVTPERNEMV